MYVTTNNRKARKCSCYACTDIWRDFITLVPLIQVSKLLTWLKITSTSNHLISCSKTESVRPENTKGDCFRFPELCVYTGVQAKWRSDLRDME